MGLLYRHCGSPVRGEVRLYLPLTAYYSLFTTDSLPPHQRTRSSSASRSRSTAQWPCSSWKPTRLRYSCVNKS